MNIRVYDHSFHDVVSGGSVIAAEFTRVWNSSGHSATLITHPEASAFFVSRKIQQTHLRIARVIQTNYTNVIIGSIAHTINAVADALMSARQNADIIFAGSWSIQDLLPALIDKFRNPHAVLVTGCYIFLHPPWKKSYGSNTVNRYVFWLEYLVGITLTKWFADVIWTASPVDAAYIRNHWRKPAAAIRGGVDSQAAARAMQRVKKKSTDAVYIGRFHPQKNILELITIWKLVTQKRPDATLVIAGAGFLKNALSKAITDGHLEKNITLLPPIDGVAKFTLLASSRIFISASHFDTGNLALDESLACGTPGVVYDLPKLTYPKGVVLVPTGNVQEFSQAVVDLLQNADKRNILGLAARNFSRSLDWNLQARRALDSVWPSIAQ